MPELQAVLERTPGNISNQHIESSVVRPSSVVRLIIGFWVPLRTPEGGSPTPLPRTPFRNIYIYIYTGRSAGTDVMVVINPFG